MAHPSMLRKSLAAVAAAGLVAAAGPAEAGALQRGFLPGLIGGFALGAFAAAAQAAHQQSALEAFNPNDLESLPEWDEGSTEILDARPSERRRPRQVPRFERKATASRMAPSLRAVSSAVASCRRSLESSSRRFGAVTVRVADAGPQTRGRDGAVEIPLTARIAYARKGQTQVRQARVTCELDGRGRVLAFR